ncbi:MAG TPA: cyclase family protein [Anaerolineales bacterium]|nr:cyclase family protein [Anaerolineales bacterium]
MRTYDITLTISPDLVVWPGDPPVEISMTETIAEGADANVSRIQMGVHTGTHIDAPRHYLEDGKTIDDLDLDMLCGRVYVLHVPEEVNLITKEVIEESRIPPRTKRVLFRTRNSNLWQSGNHTEFDQEFVALAPDACELLIQRGVKLIGVDYLSVAPYNDGVPTHVTLLQAGIVIVEGLDLSAVSQGRYTMYCLPLKIAGVEGAPARAILFGV